MTSDSSKYLAQSSRFDVPNFVNMPGAGFLPRVQLSEIQDMAWYAYCLTESQALSNGTRTRRPFLLEGIQGVKGASVLWTPSGGVPGAVAGQGVARPGTPDQGAGAIGPGTQALQPTRGRGQL